MALTHFPEPWVLGPFPECFEQPITTSRKVCWNLRSFLTII